MKHKLTNGSTGGYTHYGLEEIKIRETAREQAVVAAILEFISKEQHAAVIQRMEDVTREPVMDVLLWLGGACIWL